VDLVLQQKIVLNNIIKNPAMVRCVERRSLGNDMTVLKLDPLLILYGDVLIYLQIDADGIWESSIISHNVEYYWINLKTIKDDSSDLFYNFIWTFHGSHIKIWTGFENRNFSELASNLSTCEIDVVELPIDFYPTNVLMGKGILAGIDQQISVRNNMGCSFFRIQSKVR
jgi:hypothetical protein